jgi:hypothetical protein
LWQEASAAALAAKDQIIAAKDQVIVVKDRDLREAQDTIAAKDQEITRLRAAQVRRN